MWQKTKTEEYGQEKSKTTKQLTREINEYGTDISSRSVSRALCKENLNARGPRKKPKITPNMAKKRLEWAKGFKSWTEENWEKLI